MLWYIPYWKLSLWIDTVFTLFHASIDHILLSFQVPIPVLTKSSVTMTHWTKAQQTSIAFGAIFPAKQKKVFLLENFKLILYSHWVFHRQHDAFKSSREFCGQKDKSLQLKQLVVVCVGVCVWVCVCVCVCGCGGWGLRRIPITCQLAHIWILRTITFISLHQAIICSLQEEHIWFDHGISPVLDWIVFSYIKRNLISKRISFMCNKSGLLQHVSTQWWFQVASGRKTQCYVLYLFLYN